MSVDITFWGTRGSVACASLPYMKYGGNTSCVSVNIEGRLIILDAGSGLYDLGKWIQQQAQSPNLSSKIQHADLILTHFHFDHVMGLPFFGPLWDPGFSLTIHRACRNPQWGTLNSFLKHDLFAHPFFPVSFEDVQARIDIKEYAVGSSFSLSPDICIRSKALNHPGEATGYRIEYQNKIVSYITDTEHIVGQPDLNVIDLIQGADLVIYDSAYTDEEFQKKKGWGHSTWQEGVRLAKQANVKQLALFHHDPSHNDNVLDDLEKQAHQMWPLCFMAKQGMKIVL